MRSTYRALVAIFAGLALVAAGCGDDDDTAAGGGGDADRPTIVVTTTILGDVVENLVGDEFDVVTIMPVGADPHDFQASAQQVAEIGEAEVLIVNGAGFEEGLLDVIEAAESDGVAVFEAISAVETIEFGEAGHDHADEDHGDEDHGDEDHEDEHGDEDHADEDQPTRTMPMRTMAMRTMPTRTMPTRTMPTRTMPPTMAKRTMPMRTMVMRTSTPMRAPTRTSGPIRLAWRLRPMPSPSS